MSDKLIPIISAMSSLPEWPELLAEMESRRDQWTADAATPPVYQNHAELVKVTASAAETDYWIKLFRDAATKANGPTG